MGVEKEPLKDDKQFDKIIECATRESEDAKRLILLLRYTGMHISVLCDPKYELKEEESDGDINIIWKRTKKKNLKEAYTSIPKSKHIDFDINEFVRTTRKRRRKNKRQYFCGLIKRLGERAGVNGASPMTFRHTLGVDMLDQGYPQALVQQTLNCSDKVLKTYLKYTTKRKSSYFRNMGW